MTPGRDSEVSCASERSVTGLPGEIHHKCKRRQLTMGLEERLIHSNRPSNQVADSRSHFSRGAKFLNNTTLYRVLLFESSMFFVSSGQSLRQHRNHTVHAEGGRRVIFWIGDEHVLTEELHSSPFGNKIRHQILSRDRVVVYTSVAEDADRSCATCRTSAVPTPVSMYLTRRLTPRLR